VDILQMTRLAKVESVEYFENMLSFMDEGGDKVKVGLNNPQLEDALILE